MVDKKYINSFMTSFSKSWENKEFNNCYVTLKIKKDGTIDFITVEKKVNCDGVKNFDEVTI